MAIGTDDEYVFWTALQKLSPEVTEFPAAPYEIMIGEDGNQLTQQAWNDLPTADDKIEAVYRTAAVNKARKAFDLPSLADLRFEKNVVNIDFTVAEDITIPGYTNQQGGAPDGTDVYVYNGQAHQKITLTFGKTYVITSPSDHPVRLSTSPDGRGAGAQEFTKDLIISEQTGTITFKLKHNTILRETLYYYCASHPNMGGEFEVVAPYNEFEPDTDPADGLPVVEQEDLEFFPVYDNSLFNSLTKADIVIDVDSLPNTIGTLTKQEIVNGLAYIPTEESFNEFDGGLNEFISRVNKGHMFVDFEDAIDGYGNRLEFGSDASLDRDDPDDISRIIDQSDGIGPSALPIDLDDTELIELQTHASNFWWQRALAGVNDLRMLVAAGTYEKDGVQFFIQKDLKYYAALHGTKELTQKNEPTDLSHKWGPQHYFHFDDLHNVLNIKDPAYGVNPGGEGGQDLSKIQKIRKCKVINTAGIVNEFQDASFTVNEVPAGSLYVGSNIIVMPPNSFAEPNYDDCTRLVLWYYGSNATSLVHNNNLAYRILHDFNRKWFSDLDDETIRYPDEYYIPGAGSLDISDVKALSLNWTAGSNWGDEVPDSLFKLRRRQGGGSGPAFKINNSESFTSIPSYMETTVKASDLGLDISTRGDVSFTYRVLASNCTLNTRVFAQNRPNTFYTLDEYGFDVNPTPANGASVNNQAYYWFPLPAI